MAASDKIRWKRMINQVRFLHTEKDLVMETIQESGPKFHERYLTFAAQNGLDVQKLNEENKDRLKKLYGERTPKISAANFSDLEVSDAAAIVPYVGKQPEVSDYRVLQDDTEIKESFRKLFKQLALKLHPDKITSNITIEQGMENLKLFKEAKSALDEQRYFVLLDLADRYNISQSRNYKQQVRWMKRESERLESEIQKHKASYNYVFSECEDDEQKDALVRKFLMHLFGVQA